MDDPIRVLHVDDDPEFADLTATVLEREDDRFTVETATDPEEAVTGLADRPYDCVISDYDMPRIDGLEFLETVRSEYPDLPFILFTGKGSEQVASEALRAGATDYLQKQGGTEQYELLANRIDNAVTQARGREAERRLEIRTRAMDEAPVGITMTDPSRADNPLVYANEAFLEVTGYDRETVMGWNHRQLQGAETDPELVAEMRRAIDAGESTSVELRNYRADGTEFWNRVSISPVRDDDGSITNWVGFQEDVTDRKERERELETVYERMTHALDVTDSIIYEMDLESGTEARHGPFERLFGVASEDIPTTEIFYEQCVHPEDRERVERLQTDPPTEGTDTISFEFRTHPDRGEVRWLYSEAYVRTDDEGRPQALVGLDTDVTDRKEREQDLQRLKEEYQTVFEDVEDSLFLVEIEGTPDDPEFVMRRINPANARLLDVQRDGIRGKSPTEIFDEDIGSGIVANYEECLERGEPISYEETLDLEEGPRTFETTLTPVEVDGEITRIVGVAHDVTERKRRERELAELEEAIETVCANVPIMLFALDEEGVFTRSQGEALERIGFDPGEAVGEAVFELFEGVPEVVDACERALAGEQVTATAEIDGAVFETWYQPLREDGDVTGVVGISYDITELRERERELERQNERLEEFASVVSHDLRNPLNVAQLRLDLAREECDSDHLGDVAAALDRSQSLIDDLLALARKGESVSELEPVSLASVVDSCWRNVGTADATLGTDTEGTIRADPDRLRQLLENLFRNAVEHGATGSHSQSGDALEEDGVTITVGELPEGFYVEDDGRGIPPEDRDQVFESGYSTAAEGTGFGLAIVAEIVEAHGWEIAVTGSEDGGARFEITGVETVG